MGRGGEHAGRAGRRGGHGPGRHGGRGGRADEKHLEEARNLILNAPTRFVLTQDDRKVVLTEPDGSVRTLPTNNRKVKVGGRDVRTKWENNRLVSETTLGKVKIIETYERSPNAPQLIVTVGIDMHGHRVSVRRVYEAVTEQAFIAPEDLREEAASESGGMSWALPAGGAAVGGALGFVLGARSER